MTSERFDGNAELFSFHGKVLLGTSLLKSQMLHAEGGLITVQSQRDQEGKEGGTRDMIKTWPFPNKIININPDDFHSSLRSGVNIEAQSGSEFQANVKPVRFLLQALIQSMKPEEMDQIIKHIIKSDPPILEVPESIDNNERSFLMVFTSARGAFNFGQLISRNVKPHNVQLSLHAGPLSIDRQEGQHGITGTTFMEVNAISKHALPGLIYCSEQLAALLVMERQDLLFHPAGRIDFGDEWKEMEIYTIDLLQ
jgi:hypothetical protein